ncbi:hypothetical protein [Sphingobacterium hungaricum]|nr:hypothetical protein [Sphingobacterium hungaricum]
MNKKKNNKSQPVKEILRPVDQKFQSLENTFVNKKLRGLYALFLTLLLFGIMGMIWMIPFPQFDFLVRNNMHTFLNWGSIFIAVLIYFYLKLAPTLSYAILFTIGIMSFFIVQLEYVERDGGPAVWLVCLIIALIGFFGLVLTTKKEPKALVPKDVYQLILIGPIWLWSSVFKRLNIKY